MRPLSATEALGPAVERTKDILVRPFHWRTFLKLAAVAIFAEIGGGSGGGGGNSSSTTHSSSMFAGSLSPGVVALLVAAGVALVIVALVMFYVSSRLQLVLVELVATRQTIIAPMWRKYSSLTWRWIGLKLLFLLAVFLLVVLLGGPFLFFAIHGGGFHPSLFSIILMIVAGLGVLLVLIAAFILLCDFALPFIALEDLSISGTLSRLRSIVAADPGQVALYLLLRVVLAIVAVIGCEIAALLILLISLIPLAIIGGILWFALHNAGTAGTVILIASAVVGGILLLCWMLCVGVALFGPLFMFFQAYALYFLGGYYPLLGDILVPPPPPYFPPSLEPTLAPA